MKATEIAAQLLEMVAGWRAQILVAGRVVNHLQFVEQPRLKIKGNVA